MDKLQTIVRNESVVTHYTVSGKKYVIVVGGGMSAERNVSLMSSKDVIDALIANDYKVTFVDMGIDIANVLQQLKPDLVYNHLHGTFGEDGCIQGILNILRIPYTHSNLLASALAFSKSQSKALFIANNILAAKSIVVSSSHNIKTDPLPRPYVIKPISQGSSIGVQIIMDEDNFDFADYDFPYGDEVIIEEYVKGREMQVAILNGRALGILEIKLLENKRFYDYEAKYTKGFTEHILPAVLSEELCYRLLRTSERVYKIMGCKGLARAEFIYNVEIDDFYILELNTHPGMTALSICPEIANSVGIDFKSLVEEIVQTAGYDV